VDSSKQGRDTQLPLFDSYAASHASPLEEELQKIDPGPLSPKEALDIL
jgi:hypothetical protein